MEKWETRKRKNLSLKLAASLPVERYVTPSCRCTIGNHPPSPLPLLPLLPYPPPPLYSPLIPLPSLSSLPPQKAPEEHQHKAAKAETLDNQVLRAFGRVMGTYYRVQDGKAALDQLRNSVLIRNVSAVNGLYMRSCLIG